MHVFSSVQAKSKTEQCQCAFKYHSSARKRERECYNYVCVCVFSLVLANVSVHIYVCICVYLCVYVFAKWCIFVSLSVCAGREWGSVVCFVCRRPWMLSRLQLGTAMVLVQCRKQQEPASYKLKGHTLKTSTFPLASSSMSSRAMKQAVDARIVLGCQSEQEVQGSFRFI